MSNRVARTAGLIVLGVAAVAVVGALLVKDQMSRHRRDLFSSHPLRRLAALGYIARRSASVDVVQLLRDFVAWEPRPLLRRRALQILERMEEEVRRSVVPSEEVAG